jgi:hypothetical protein
VQRSLAAASAALVLSLASGVRAEDHPPKLEVRVLYAGPEGWPRTKAFAEFLGGHFAKVGTIDPARLSMEAARDWDVVIVDAPGPDEWRGDSPRIKLAEVGREFTRPTILVGAAGGDVLSRLRIKLDWL